MMNVPIVTPAELRAELAGEHPPVVVDVREGFELAISKLEGAIHIPIGQFAARMLELSPTDDIVIICRTGARSAQVTAYMLAQGYHKVRNLATGLNGWSRTVDPTVQAY